MGGVPQNVTKPYYWNAVHAWGSCNGHNISPNSSSLDAVSWVALTTILSFVFRPAEKWVWDRLGAIISLRTLIQQLKYHKKCHGSPSSSQNSPSSACYFTGFCSIYFRLQNGRLSGSKWVHFHREK